jgi:hypothetical protein
MEKQPEYKKGIDRIWDTVYNSCNPTRRKGVQKHPAPLFVGKTRKWK